MRTWPVLVLGLIACGPQQGYAPTRPPATIDVPPPVTAPDPASLGKLEDRSVEWVFDGGQIELELYRRGSRVVQVARNRYAVPVVVRWMFGSLQNLDPLSPVEGVATLPAAPAPFGVGPNVVLAELELYDASRHYHRELFVRARWGDPRAAPSNYAYRLPYPTPLQFSVLQGWRGAFSHRGSNEYAVDFDCPVATSVLAARPGVVVAVNAAAQGAGTTPEWLDYRRTNFVLVLHEDGTLGEYMHLSPSGIEVKPGQRVERGQSIALSGNTGFSSTPHLHFQVMTASADGLAARSFPFRFAVSPTRVEEPVQGRHYASWEVPTVR
jgi:murein DD-endopeptidase MepM/ murein hydrolase activator NlpD